ncbi:MAG: UDP-N-acetylmuramoylalanyl-D-glutamate--2,6-diaminopimelate ligase, partial [Chitinophagaceae bacterium]
FDHLRAAGGSAFIMADYDYLHDMSRGIPEVITYGSSNADYTGTVAQADPFLSVAFEKGFAGTVHTQLVGSYNLPNVLAAVAVGRHFAVPEEAIRAALEGYAPSNSRSQLVEKGSNRIILDAYNANPSSMKLAVENFARASGSGKVLVLGAMAELGPESLHEHSSLAALIGQHPWTEVLLVGGDFQKIEHPFRRFATAGEAGEWLRQQGYRETSFLVKGSRSTGMEKVLDYI